MKSGSLLIVFALRVFLLSTTNACHNSLHVKPSSALDISGRKKRDVGPHPHPHSNHSSEKDADPALSLFFSDCMFRKTGSIFESWPSVIDFILRDLYWFEASDIAYCGGYKDTAKCWQRRLNFLLRLSSDLMEPGKECIAEYDKSVKNERGPAFELYYRTHYDSYQYEPVFGEFKRFKRQIFEGDDTFRRAEDILNNLDDFLDTKFTTPRTYFQGPPTSGPKVISTGNQEGSECPPFSEVEFGICIQTKIDELVRTNLVTKYPSLKNFDEKSNIRFFEDHLSSCRITKEMRGRKVVYMENCPVSNARSKRQANNEFNQQTIPQDGDGTYSIFDSEPSSSSKVLPYVPSTIVTEEPCLILDFPDVVKPASPVHRPVQICADQYLSKISNETDEVTEPSPTLTPSNRSQYERAVVRGKVGVCTKDDAWTKFYNDHSPDGDGEFETLEDLLIKYPELICKSPNSVDVRIAKNNRPHSRSKELLYISITDGLRCYNDEQKDGGCQDYKIRFCCPKQPPCDAPNSWTEWFNRPLNRLFGERETLDYHRVNNNVCDNPLGIRARLRGSKKPYWVGNNIIEISPVIGFICRNADQSRNRCRNYEVSFCCPFQA